MSPHEAHCPFDCFPLGALPFRQGWRHRCATVWLWTFTSHEVAKRIGVARTFHRVWSKSGRFFGLISHSYRQAYVCDRRKCHRSFENAVRNRCSTTSAAIPIAWPSPTTGWSASTMAALGFTGRTIAITIRARPWTWTQRSSSAASCSTCCPRASSAFAITDFSEIGTDAKKPDHCRRRGA